MLAVKHFNSKLHITPRAKIKFIVIVSIVQCVNPVQRETSLKHPDTSNSCISLKKLHSSDSSGDVMVSNKRWKKKTLGSGATGGRHCVKGHVTQVAGGKLLKSDFQKQRIEKETHYKDLGDSLLVSDLRRLHSETETQELCSSSGLVQYRRDKSDEKNRRRARTDRWLPLSVCPHASCFSCCPGPSQVSE